MNNVPVNSGAAFPIANVSRFTHITGIASIIGSATIRLRTGFNANGTFVVTSNWSINSGVSILDAPIYGGSLLAST